MKLRIKTVAKIGLVIARIAGPIVTGYLGIKAGEKADELKKEGQFDAVDEPGRFYVYDELDTKDKIKAMLPVYAPVVIAAGLTIAANLVDKHLDKKEFKQLATMYTASALSASTYRKKLVEENPEAAKEADKEIHEEIVKTYPDLPWNEEDEISKNPGDELFVDFFTGRRFRSNFDAVSKALTEVEQEYESPEWRIYDGRGHLDVYGCWPSRTMPLNELYSKLGIERTWFGNRFGYLGVYDKDSETWKGTGEHISFHIEDGPDGIHYIMYDNLPVEGWYEA